MTVSDPGNTFELGLFSFVERVPDPVTGQVISEAQRLQNLIETIELADQVGLDVFGVGEHHRPDFVASAPAIILAAAAARTQRIRLSTAVTVLSSDDPVRVSSELRHAGFAEQRPGGDHGRARFVHRVLPAFWLRPARLR